MEPQKKIWENILIDIFCAVVLTFVFFFLFIGFNGSFWQAFLFYFFGWLIVVLIINHWDWIKS